MNGTRPLLGKVILAGVMRTLTGLHIGGAKETMEIGALDLPVIREQKSGVPYIPGSSLKGKMRSLTERRLEKPAKRPIRDVNIHVCDTTQEAEGCEVCRVFGASGFGRGNQGKNFPARLRVRDGLMMLYSQEALRRAATDLPFTEVKVENALDRITSAANPRRVERVPAGTDFRFELVYDVEKPEDVLDDLNLVLAAMQMVEDDALGGHGTRGSGKVRFCFSKVEAKKSQAYVDPEARDAVMRLVDMEEPKDENSVQGLPGVEEVMRQIEGLKGFFGKA